MCNMCVYICIYIYRLIHDCLSRVGRWSAPGAEALGVGQLQGPVIVHAHDALDASDAMRWANSPHII